MKKIIALAAMALCSLSSQAATGTELLTNGSFESAVSLNADGYCYSQNCGPIEGWNGYWALQIDKDATVLGTPGNMAGFGASFGEQVAGIQNTATISQSVTGAGGQYTLSWYDAGRLNDGGQTYQVLFGGSTIGTFGVNSGQGWSLNSFTFTAAAGIQQLSFVGIGTQADGSVLLDKVSLTGSPAVSPVPEPESVAMMLAGLGVLGAMGRRQRKTA
jgi:PEP-CTERM motif